MTDSEEKTYWHDFIDGDLDALSLLFLHNARRLFSYGMKICRDKELVKDSIQEVFIRLIQKRCRLNSESNVKGLVYRLLRNELIDGIKRNNSSRKFDNLFFSPNSYFETDAEHQFIGIEEEMIRNNQLTLALEQLSAHQKEAMYLKYAEGLTYEQIAEVLGISVPSTRTLIYRTLGQMKNFITRELKTGADTPKRPCKVLTHLNDQIILEFGHPIQQKQT